MTDAPIISVIMPAHDEERYIARAIRSVLNQTFAGNRFEVIVVDDASVDRTGFVAGLFGESVRLMRNPQQMGLPASLNRGIKSAKGKYVIRVDADDYVSSDYLYILNRFLEDNTDFDAVACDYFLVDEHENIIARRNCLEEPIGCGIMFRIEQLIGIGLYDPDFRLLEDEDLRIRFLKRHSIIRISLPLYRYRRHVGNMSSDQGARKTYRARLHAKHERQGKAKR